MSELVELEALTPSLVKPYVVTRSKLGSTTKVIEKKIVCKTENLFSLYESLGEKVSSFNPSKAGFQYLISFTDNTHFEHSDLSELSNRVSASGKKNRKNHS